MVPVEPGELPHFVRGDADYGQWAVLDLDALAGAMRTMYRMRDELRTKALRAAEGVGRRWSWDAAAEGVGRRWSWDAVAEVACRRIDALLEQGRSEAT